MTCDRYQEWASQYADAELQDAKTPQLFRHLSACVECRRFLKESLELRSLIRDELISEGNAKSRQAIRSTQTPLHFGVRAHAWMRRALLVGALVAAAFIAGRMSRSANEDYAQKGQSTIYVSKLPAIEVRAY